MDSPRELQVESNSSSVHGKMRELLYDDEHIQPARFLVIDVHRNFDSSEAFTTSVGSLTALPESFLSSRSFTTQYISLLSSLGESLPLGRRRQLRGKYASHTFFLYIYVRRYS